MSEIKELLESLDTFNLLHMMDELSLVTDYQDDRNDLIEQFMDAIEDHDLDFDDVNDLAYSAAIHLRESSIENDEHYEEFFIDDDLDDEFLDEDS